MNDKRNLYGFPADLPFAEDELPHPNSGRTREEITRYINWANAYYKKPIAQTKLERAHAIAAEVRARKFAPVRRIDTEKVLAEHQ